MTEQNVCYYENSDEPTCPSCNGYNAMLTDHEAHYAWRQEPGIVDQRTGFYQYPPPDYRKCRDCGTTAVRVEK